MPTLFVRCHRCGREFPSGIAPTDGELGRVELLGVLHRCPHCRDLSRYDTPEYYFPARAERPAGEPRPPATRADRSRTVHDVALPPGPRHRPATLQP